MSCAALSESRAAMDGHAGKEEIVLDGKALKVEQLGEEQQIYRVRGFVSPEEVAGLVHIHKTVMHGAPPPILCDSAHHFTEMIKAGGGAAAADPTAHYLTGYECLKPAPNHQGFAFAKDIRWSNSTAHYADELALVDAIDQRIGQSVPCAAPAPGLAALCRPALRPPWAALASCVCVYACACAPAF